jgi:hypothetical protein
MRALGFNGLCSGADEPLVTMDQSSIKNVFGEDALLKSILY